MINPLKKKSERRRFLVKEKEKMWVVDDAHDLSDTLGFGSRTFIWILQLVLMVEFQHGVMEWCRIYVDYVHVTTRYVSVFLSDNGVCR